MIRSGSTVQYQIAAELVEMKGLGRRVEWIDESNHAIEIPKRDSDELLVFKSHAFTPTIAEEFEKNNAKALYIYRDLRDVAVSHSQKYEMPISAIIDKDLIGGAIMQYHNWTSSGNVLISRYEDLVRNLHAHISDIASFTGIGLSNDEILAVAEKFSPENQIKTIEDAVKSNRLTSLNNVSFDSRNLLHTDHISPDRGKINKWKEHFKEDELAIFEEKYGAWLIDHGYELKNPGIYDN
ncbi:MAG: sulfotransferase domain-containing protein [Candidatus Kapaibacterium sp.]